MKKMKTDSDKVENLIKAIHAYADEECKRILPARQSSVSYKIRDKELKNIIGYLKHIAVVKKQYEFAMEVRDLERKYFVTNKSK